MLLSQHPAAAMSARLLSLVSRDPWSLALVCRRLNQGQYERWHPTCHPTDGGTLRAIRPAWETCTHFVTQWVV